MIDSQQSSTPFVYSTPATANTTTYGSGETTGRLYGNSYSGDTYLYAHSTTTYTPGQTFIFYKPSSGLLIRAFPEKPDNIPTFDAVFLRNQISSCYKIKIAHSAVASKPQVEPVKSITNPDEGKYVLWKDFVGLQKDWPVAKQSFVSKIEDFPVYDRGQFPSNPYTVIGQIESATMLGVEPMDEVLKEAVHFAKSHGAKALIEIENQATPNPRGPMLFFHKWYAVKFSTEPVPANLPPTNP